METVKNLARNGVLKGVPPDIPKKLLDGKPIQGSLSPLDGDTERAGLERPQGLCVLAYVGRELREKKIDNQHCMTMNQDYPIEPIQVQPDLTESEGSVDLPLRPGQRYAVNDERTKILLDSRASRSMISLDLARRLKLKSRMLVDPVKVSGLGGVQSYITAMARVKITLGMNVVYVMNVWLANIGEGLEVLLGMDFMYAAGMRLCIREGLVRMTDEEMVVMCTGPNRERVGQDVPVHPDETLHLQPGEHAITNPQRKVVWAGRGDRWVTQVIYAAKSWAVAVKVVNISQSRLWLNTGTVVARMVEYGYFPQAGRFVRPGRQRYKEWSQLIYEDTKSIERQRYERKLAELEESLRPPCVQAREYRWPSKLLLRPESGATTARVACLQVKFDRLEPGKRMVKMTSDAGTQTCETCDVSTQTDPGWDSECEDVLHASRDSVRMEYGAEPEPERSADPAE
ncbi:hypothetical protein PHMEG_00016818 [Phytophthora megakarya]|uniref:Peptidase A2 domain-containing protein n=1 Tax=Phytophthora megakarya TaxID=4795 RepID=A0A225VY19_9STRA|nr:hypothetical protein PHMEG_00016818 [Phytophthora megakarya]